MRNRILFVIGVLSVVSCGEAEVVFEDDDVHCSSNWEESNVQQFPVSRNFCLNSAGQIAYFKENYNNLGVYQQIVFGSSLTQEEFETIEGFESELVRVVSIKGNASIRDLSVLAGIGTVGGWRFEGATGFTDLSTLPVHDKMWDLILWDTTNIEVVELPPGANFTREDSPYQGVFDPAGVILERNENLREVRGFNGVVTLAQLKVEGNPRLRAVSGFESLEDVGDFWWIDNKSLVSVRGFGALIVLRQLAVSYNPKLSDFPALQDSLEEVIIACSVVSNALLARCLALAICGPFEEQLGDDRYAVRGNDDSQTCD